jgi:hypothetical protein
MLMRENKMFVRRLGASFLVIAAIVLGWWGIGLSQQSTGTPGSISIDTPVPPSPIEPLQQHIAVFGDNCIDNWLSLNGFNTTLVTDADIAMPGFLDAFAALVVTRNDAEFGSGLSGEAAARVQSYVGQTGNVVLFPGDWADMVIITDPACDVSGDPEDAKVKQLILNAVAFAAASGRGYVGELNGAAMAVSSNANEFNPLNLLAGNASPVDEGFDDAVDTVSLTAAGMEHPVTAGVSFPFSPTEESTFRTAITGVPAANVLAVWADQVPAILARGEAAPPPLCTLRLEASATDGTLSLAFTIGTQEPATWNVWLTVQSDIIRLLSAPLPTIDPLIQIPITIPFFPPLGNIGVLTTLTTPDEGIICSDFATVDTGPIPEGQSPTMHELQDLFLKRYKP